MKIDGKYKNKKIHRLVAETFLTNFLNKPCIDHIDRNKNNNHYSNLRFVTPKENSNNENTIQHLKNISIVEASRRTKIPRSNIQYHLKNRTGEWFYV